MRRFALVACINRRSRFYSSASPKSLAGPDGAIAQQDFAHALRNEVGVQLLSRDLHKQIFPTTTVLPPDPRAIVVAQEHLKAHGLDPKQASVLESTSFTLPSLRGSNIRDHFHNVGSEEAEPWLSLAKAFASAQMPNPPTQWCQKSGWTKYTYRDGWTHESVQFPDEPSLAFDVETLPSYGHSAIMACAVSSKAWYAWLSPWLLGESEEHHQLIPMGPPDYHRVIVGHNVSFDRSRIKEEYFFHGTKSRFIDTMSLHVAVSGISSNQRPAWIAHKKKKVAANLRDTQSSASEADVDSSSGVTSMHLSMAEEETNSPSSRWEDVTSVSSLKEVALLHCGIDMDKDTRLDFLELTREEIGESLQTYMTYCAEDVRTTQLVYSVIFPQFLQRCPSPVSFVGMLEMGSSFLPVNQSWERYISEADRVFLGMEGKVKGFLRRLAEMARETNLEDVTSDPWLSQLDWTPKVARQSRGVTHSNPSTNKKVRIPRWLRDYVRLGAFSPKVMTRILPLLLRVQYEGQPVQFSEEAGWHIICDGKIIMLSSASRALNNIFGKTFANKAIQSNLLDTSNQTLAKAIIAGDRSSETAEMIGALAQSVQSLSAETISADPWLRQLDWSLAKGSTKDHEEQLVKVEWPKWYWDLAAPSKDRAPGHIEVTVRSRIAPLLMRLSWLTFPLTFSKAHGWIYRVPKGNVHQSRSSPLAFQNPGDATLYAQQEAGYDFYKLPHKDGEAANVGSPLSKTFFKYVEDGTLSGPGDMAREALDLNVQCSYWMSVRDRIKAQQVTWQTERLPLGFEGMGAGERWGVILPQVITMGAVTRRAIEKTWLTASNAKSNRVGSELKAMVRAPPGYTIVGADVDSEELWISSCIGDAQFGLHGATALGWMTLEGTKTTGTDLHSKTASILGISRGEAKVFNYSRIYGAGMRHAMLLLLQANPTMAPENAERLAKKLYATTKGIATRNGDLFNTKFWYGGTESYVFNKLEDIALSDFPQTPALDCGITHALSKQFLPSGYGSNYMTSRINWVVQSSGVDYLHLLIVAMNHLCKSYDIGARYLISVHDELRYLVKDSDKYRAALALQIANLWTRSLFAFKLGMSDLPESVAFFSSVDVDRVLRKEVDMPCVTPSHPNPIPPGESFNIRQILEKTNGGSLWENGHPMDTASTSSARPQASYEADLLKYRSPSLEFLKAQASVELNEIKLLAKQTQKIKGQSPSRKKKSAKLP